MSTFVQKIRNGFSDAWLEVELFFGRLFKRRKKDDAPKIEYMIPQSKDEEAVSTSLSPSPVRSEQTVAVSSSMPKPVSKPPSVKSTLKAVIQKSTNKQQARKEQLPFGLRMLRFSGKERLAFFDQMATLIGSEVSLIDSLNLLRAQTRRKNMKKLYADMIHRINAGLSLADTMGIYSHLFPKMQVALIEAGEKSGNLKLVLGEIVNEMDDQQTFLRKVKGAMFYPIILLILACVMVVGMMLFVIPRIAGMYEQSNVALPGLTQKVIDISGFVQLQWKWILFGLIGFLLFFWLLTHKTRFGQLGWEKFVRGFPLFGTIAKEKNLMVIASNMGMLMKSGVLITEAFEITEKAVGNLHYQRAIADIRHGVMMGKPVSVMMGLENIEDKNFKESKLFPLQFAQLIHIGETTGTISEMLYKSRENLHKSIDYKLKNISTVIEPLMILIVAALVGSILMAVMLPFFYIGTTIS